MFKYSWDMDQVPMELSNLDIVNICSISLHIPCSVWRQCPVRTSHTRTVESALPDTRMLLRSSIPLVSDWCPVSVWTQPPSGEKQPPSASHSHHRSREKSRKEQRTCFCIPHSDRRVQRAADHKNSIKLPQETPKTKESASTLQETHLTHSVPFSFIDISV